MTKNKSDMNSLTAAEERVKQLEADRSRMESFLQAHDSLTRMVLNGQGLSEITAHFGELIQHSVEIEDRFHNLLGVYTRPASADQLHLDRAAAFAGHLSVELLGEPILIEQTFQAIISYQRPGSELPYRIAEPQPERGQTRLRLVAPVMVEQELLGYVILLDRRGGFSERVIQALEHAALIYALLMMKEKSEAQTEQRLRADFIEDLISGQAGLDQANLLRRGRYFGFNRAAAYLFLLVELDDFETQSEKLNWDEGFSRSFLRHLTNEMSRAVRNLAPDSLLSGKGPTLTILAPLSKDTHEAEQTRLLDQAIRQSLNRVTGRDEKPFTLSIGIGGVCRSLEDFPSAARRAQRCQELLKMLGRSGQTVNYADLGLYSLLLDRQNKQPLFDFAAAQLKSLQEYDKTHRAGLLETLRIYFAHSMRLKETAQACQIHLSALKYRLGRLQEVGNFSLNDPDACFNLQLALKISEVDRIFYPTKTDL